MISLRFFRKRVILTIGTVLVLIGLIGYSWFPPEEPDEPVEPDWDAINAIEDPLYRQRAINDYQARLDEYLEEEEEYEAKYDTYQYLQFFSVWFLWIGVVVLFWSTAVPPERKASNK